MKYILEKISLSIFEELIKGNCDLQNDFVFNSIIRRSDQIFKNPDRNWAVDKENKSFLFYGPAYGDREYLYYTFYFRNKFYRLRMKHFNNLVGFENHKDNPSEITTDIKQAIFEAFVIYGQLGEISQDQFKVSATFKH